MFLLPEFWYNIFLTVYLVDAMASVVLAVGWLTCANYYYKLDETGVAIHITIMAIISILLGISLFVPDKSFNEGLLVTHAFIVAAVVIMVLAHMFFYGILSLREYFKTKRGR